MAVTIKNEEAQQKMRVAGRLAADVLDMIGDYVKPGSQRENWIAFAMNTSPMSKKPSPPP